MEQLKLFGNALVFDNSNKYKADVSRSYFSLVRENYLTLSNITSIKGLYFAINANIWCLW
jgi:hypothetical protein